MSKSFLAILVLLGAALIFGGWYLGRNPSEKQGTDHTTSTVSTSSVAAPSFVTRQETRVSAERYCVFTISYPEAQIRDNAEVESWVNRYLKTQFVPSDKEIADCEASVKDFTTAPITQTTTVSYSVKLSTPGLVSVTYTASSYFEGAAHPNNLIKAFTLDLQNRKIVSFQDLLIPNTEDEFNDLLYTAVAKAFTDAKQEVYFSRATFLASYAKDTYEFYLTPDSLVVIGLFDVYALQGLEAKIPLYELKSYVDPRSVLMQLISEEA